MFDSKVYVPSTKLHLPAVSKRTRQRFVSSPTPSYTSMASTNVTENVSELKAKYTDYAMWLKASARQNREPVFTHELLKHSLCQMGIDTSQAEQLVSTCSWYVYQFQKELGVDTQQSEHSVTSETKKSSTSTRRRHRKTRATKPKKVPPPREHSAESVTTTTSINKESLISLDSSSPIRGRYAVLPAIHPSDSSLSPRSRHVDFDHERSIRQSPDKVKPSHWRSAAVKTRVLPKLRTRTETLSSVHDLTPESTPSDFDPSSSHRNLPRHPLAPVHTRSILRKQNSSCSSVTTTDIYNRKNRQRILTPASTIIDEVPLGTKSQRLFGGSECFAQIMNELEEQKLS